MNCSRVMANPESHTVIRLAVPDDLDQLARLYRQNHISTYRALLPAGYSAALTLSKCREKWSRFLACPENRIWTAYEGEALLGFAAGTPDASLSQTWYLESLHVAEQARGMGLGSKLIRTAGAFAAKNGYERMSVCIVRGNDQAAALYERLGALHFAFFEDAFQGYPFAAEKLLWDNPPH